MLIFNLQMLSMVNIPNSLKLTKYKHYTMHVDFISDPSRAQDALKKQSGIQE